MENRARNLPAKLITKDLSESLGKLPPQALDLEEAVLGALMIEVRTIDKVPFLQPHHFYKEQHAEVFRAIRAIHLAGDLPDFRMVISQLRGSGKLEVVGGQFVIVELTTKVSSAANLEAHARVIVEQAMKRNLIEIASGIHQQAYDDTTDVFQLLQRVQEDIAFVESRETKNDGPEKIRLLWEQSLIGSRPDEQQPLICLGETPVCTPGNHTLVVGKKKSRKSLLITLLLSIFLKSRENLAGHIAVFDTEQGKLHVWKGKDRLYRMTNQEAPFFWLRGKSPQQRREFISQSVEHWNTRSPVPLKIMVIDGIRDCMKNINSEEETTEVIVWLEDLTNRYNLGIINVLHLNKTDGNARGHIGSELLNKAECIIEVSYDEKTTFSRVKCESAREKPFDPFDFTHSPTGLPELLGVIVESNTSKNEVVKRLTEIFEDSSLRFAELTELVSQHFGKGATVAKRMIRDWVRQGWILKSGKDRSPSTTYKLMVSEGKYVPPPEVLPDPQLDLHTSDDLPF